MYICIHIYIYTHINVVIYYNYYNIRLDIPRSPTSRPGSASCCSARRRRLGRPTPTGGCTMLSSKHILHINTCYTILYYTILYDTILYDTMI